MSRGWKEMGMELGRRYGEEVMERRAVGVLKGSEGKVGICFSGGADSLFVLLWVWGRWERMRGRMVGLHYNHGLRGEESEGDERFCEEVAGELGIEFRKGRSEGMKIGGGEAELREERHEFLRKVMREEGGEVLVTGHHLDDFAESFLMRGARGGGLGSLVVPRGVVRHGDGFVYVRPLMMMSREGVREGLRGIGAEWREDSSNEKGVYYRNRVRQEVVPVWREVAPTDFYKGLRVSYVCLEEEAELIEELVREWVGRVKVGVEWDFGVMEGKWRGLRRRVLREFFIELGREVSWGVFEGVLKCVEEGREGRWEIGVGEWVVVKKGRVYLAGIKEKEVRRWEGGGKLVEGVSYYLPHGGELRMEVVKLDEGLWGRIKNGEVDNEVEAYVKLGEGEEMRYRGWIEGDRYEPIGMGGREKKLQDAFTDRKVSREGRLKRPVVMKGWKIVWVPGLPIGEVGRIEGEEEFVIQLTYKGEALLI